VVFQGFWRRRRDSNPRYALRAYNGLANRRLQPLGHVSRSEIAYRIRLSWVKGKTPEAQGTQVNRSRGGTKRGTVASLSQGRCSVPIPPTNRPRHHPYRRHKSHRPALPTRPFWRGLRVPTGKTSGHSPHSFQASRDYPTPPIPQSRLANHC
jgi:hypothetical protein